MLLEVWSKTQTTPDSVIIQNQMTDTRTFEIVGEVMRRKYRLQLLWLSTWYQNIIVLLVVMENMMSDIT